MTQPQNFGQAPDHGQPSSPHQQPIQAPLGFIDLTIQGNIWTAPTPLPPRVLINGYRVPVRYGVQQIPVPAGPVRVEANIQWLVPMGKASLDFMLAPGHRVPVFYTGPWHQYTAGSMGFEPQKRKGLGLALVSLTLVVLLFLTSVMVALMFL